MDYTNMNATDLLEQTNWLKEGLQNADLRRSAAATSDFERRQGNLVTDDTDQTQPNPYLEGVKGTLDECRSAIESVKTLVRLVRAQKRSATDAVQDMRKLVPQAQAALDAATTKLNNAESWSPSKPPATPEKSKDANDYSEPNGGSTDDAEEVDNDTSKAAPKPGPHSTPTKPSSDDDKVEPEVTSTTPPPNTTDATQSQPAVKDDEGDAADTQQTEQDSEDLRELIELLPAMQLLLPHTDALVKVARPIEAATTFVNNRTSPRRSNSTAHRPDDKSGRSGWRGKFAQKDSPYDESPDSSYPTNGSVDPDGSIDADK